MKNSTVIVMACLFSFAISGMAQEKVLPYSVVEKIDSVKRSTYEVMTPEQLQVAKDELKIKMKMHPKAVSLSQKAWKEDAVLKSYPMPQLSAPSIKVVKGFAEEAGANELAESMNTKAKEALDKIKEAEVEKAKKQEEKDKAKGKKDTKSKTAPSKILDEAKSLYDSKLDEAVTAAAEAAAAAQNPGKATEKAAEDE